MTVRDHVAVARDVGGHHRRAGRERLGQHHPERLAAQRRRAEDVRARERLALLLLADAAEGLDGTLVVEQRRQLALVDADHRQARVDVLVQRVERAQQDLQALALDDLADEGDLERLARRAAARGGHAAGREGDAVGHDPVLAAEEAPRGPLGGLGHRDPHPQPVEVAPRAPRHRDAVGERVLGVGVEGADQRRDGRADRDRVPAGHGRHRLVDMDDVEAARAQLAPHGRGRVRREREARDRAVERQADRRPERDQPRGRRGGVPVVRRGHADVVPRGHQGLAQSLHVAGHSTGIRPSIGRDDGDAHDQGR